MSTTKIDTRKLDVITLEDASILAGSVARLEDAIGIPFEKWSHDCHRISVQLIRTGLFGRARAARGGCPGVGAQHSWIVLGDNPYDDGIPVVDPTLWSYRDDVDGIFAGYRDEYGHTPHGDYACYVSPVPEHHGGKDIELTPREPLSPRARDFLARLLPLDFHGWGIVAHLGVHGWPAAEIITAMYDTDALRALIPVDIAGMLTDRNPGNQYW